LPNLGEIKIILNIVSAAKWKGGKLMGPKKTSFSSDECQCLLDVIDRVVADNWSRRDGKRMGMFLTTEEERVMYEKLKKAGEFYIPILTL